LAFSCRKRAASAPQRASQNANDLAREAVSCNAGLGGNSVLDAPIQNHLAYCRISGLPNKSNAAVQ
jgi:hypothetical protein